MNPMKTAVLLSLTGALALLGCEEQSTNKIVLGAPAAGDCDLTLDSMVGKTFVLEKINADKTTQPDIQTRLQLGKDGESFTAKYNAASLSDMYDYSCKPRKDELICYEDLGEKLPDFCKALVAGKAECTPEALKKLAPMATDEAIAAAVKEGNEAAEKYKGKPEWEKFVFANNNLGNKLMGILYVGVDKKSCQPQITDNYMTIYDGKKIEDSNPVGTNKFVATDKTLIFEHCTDSNNLVAFKDAELPKDLSEVRTTLDWAVGSEINYHFVDESDEGKPVEGCTYSFDFWRGWEPNKEGVAAEVAGKHVNWHFAQKYDEPGNVVTHMVRYKTCEGKQEQVDVACNLVVVK